MANEWQKQAERLRELARDPAVRAYLLGRLLSEVSAADAADLVEACLVYRERFGAAGNYRDTRRAEAGLTPNFGEDFAWTRGTRDANYT